MDLLELVMNVQEKVAELEFADENEKKLQLKSIEPLLAELTERRRHIDAGCDLLRQQWDATANHSDPGSELAEEEKKILQQIAKELAARAYITTLLDSLVAATKGESLILKH